jgi:hypothetical protein
MWTARSVHASQKALLGTEWAVPVFSQATLRLFRARLDHLAHAVEFLAKLAFAEA